MKRNYKGQVSKNQKECRGNKRHPGRRGGHIFMGGREGSAPDIGHFLDSAVLIGSPGAGGRGLWQAVR